MSHPWKVKLQNPKTDGSHSDWNFLFMWIAWRDYIKVTSEPHKKKLFQIVGLCCVNLVWCWSFLVAYLQLISITSLLLTRTFDFISALNFKLIAKVVSFLLPTYGLMNKTNRLFVSFVRQRLPIAKCLHCFKRSLYSLKPNIIWRERALFSTIHSLFLSLPALSLSSNVSEHWVSVCHSLQSERFVMNDKFTMNESFLAGNRLMKWECHAVIGALRIRLSREKKIPLHRQWSVKKFDNNKNQMAAVDRCNVPFSINGQTQAQLEQTK